MKMQEDIFHLICLKLNSILSKILDFIGKILEFGSTKP